MGNLSRSESAFVRGSPSRGVLGGIAEYTDDVLFLCTAAGFDKCIVESVGLGQVHKSPSLLHTLSSVLSTLSSY